MAEKITKIIKYSIGGFLALVVVMFITVAILGDDVNEDLLLQYQIAEQDDTSYLNCKRTGLHVLVPNDATQEKVDYTLGQIIEDKKIQWDEITVWAYGYNEENKIGQGFTKGMEEYSSCD